jgi:hypothetical protein
MPNMSSQSLVLKLGVLALSFFTQQSSAQLSSQYVLSETYAGANFFDGFNFFTDPDPTVGFVE